MGELWRATMHFSLFQPDWGLLRPRGPAATPQHATSAHQGMVDLARIAEPCAAVQLGTALSRLGGAHPVQHHSKNTRSEGPACIR